MRISEAEADAIIASVEKFDPDAEVYLFGSRADDQKRGGDIDILVKSDLLDRSVLGQIEEELFTRIEEQKVDFVLTGKTTLSKFAEMVLGKGAVRLCRMKS